MSVMGGLEAIGRIIASDPGARIVAQSAGWTENALDPLVVALDLGAAGTISKPYELTDLAVVISSVQLGESNPRGENLPAPGREGRKKREDAGRRGAEKRGSARPA